MNRNHTAQHPGSRPKKHHSTASVVLTITLIAILVLALIVLFINLAGIRYIRVSYEEGDVKFFGTVDDYIHSNLGKMWIINSQGAETHA